MTPIRATLITLLLALVATPAALGESGPQPSGKPLPKIVQLSYSEVNDGSSPRYRLQGFAHRADSLTFRARYRGRTASAGSRYDKSITDTDLRGDARHPFVLQRKGGGRRVLKLVRRALSKRGVAKVRMRARGAGGVDAVRAKIVLAKCSKDPPFYPVDCEVRP